MEITMILLLITLTALSATASPEPATIYFRNGGIWSFPQTSAALLGSAPLITTGVNPIAPVSPFGPVAPVAPVAPIAPLAPYTSVSDYRYSYGSSYNYQDYYPVVNSALSLPYSLPYAYAADWYYRK